MAIRKILGKLAKLHGVLIAAVILAMGGGIAAFSQTEGAVSLSACSQTLNPGDDIGSAIAAASGGTVICLNSGTYSGISASNNTSRTDYVTVQPSSGATVDVSGLNIDNVSYVHLTGVTFRGGLLKGHHLHITNATGASRLVNNVSQILKVYGTINNADILIDNITYSDIPNPCTNNSCPEGRISVMDGGSPSGITISNSYFSGGNSDGIQVFGTPTGVQIIGNEFTNILAASGTHTDAIQLYYDGSGTVIKNNYIHNTETGIMAPNGPSGPGGTNEQVIGNIIDMTSYPFVLNIASWNGGLIAHNTFLYGTTCSWNSCGTPWMASGSNVQFRDNIIGEWKVDSGTFTEDYDLIKVGRSAHDHTITGLPTYVGGSHPTTWAGFQLAVGSAGKNAASDGTDMGANYFGSGGGSTDTTAPTVSLTAPAAGSVSGNVALTASASDNVGVTSVQFLLDGSPLGGPDTAAPYSYVWDSSQVSNGTHALSATAQDAAGNTATATAVTVTVSGGLQILLGTQTVQSGTDSSSAGSAEAFRYTATGSGTAHSLGVYMGSVSAGTAIKVGLYTNNGGHPGTLLASGSIGSPVANSWNVAALSPGAAVTSGATYWMAVLGVGGTANYRDLGSGSCSESSSAANLSSLPTTWSSGTTYTTCSLSAYVSTHKQGDINNDGVINGIDVSAVVNDYGKPTNQRSFTGSDINGDSVVNGLDISTVTNNFGS